MKKYKQLTLFDGVKKDINHDELNATKKLIEDIGIFDIDVETSSLFWYKGQMCGFAIGVPIDKQFTNYKTLYLPIRHKYGNNHEIAPILNFIKDICEDENIVKINHNIKFDMHFLENDNIYIKGQIHDSMILMYLLNELEESLKLKELGDKYLYKGASLEEKKLKEFMRKNKIIGKYHYVPSSKMSEYAKTDTILPLELLKQFYPDIINGGLKNIYDTEIKLIKVLQKIERKGIFIDEERLEKHRINYTNSINNVQNILIKKLGNININSNQQLGNKLIKLGYNLPKNDKGIILTDKKTLSSFNDYFLNKIIEYNGLTTIFKTFIKGISEKLINGKLHTSYNQIPKTGRLSSSDPNLQNIPPEMRNMFYGKYLKGFDWSQIEYRIFVHYLNDKRLIEAYKNGADFHQTCADMFNLSRKDGKNINFGLIYGLGIKALANNLKKSYDDALKLMNDYKKQIPSLENLQNDLVKVAKRRGYIINLYGRHQHFEKGFEYKLLNKLIQSSAADMLKDAMIKLEDYPQILNIHDELIFDNIDDNQEKEIVKIMENFPQLNVPIKVDIEDYGKYWGKK